MNTIIFAPDVLRVHSLLDVFTTTDSSKDRHYNRPMGSQRRAMP